MEILPELASEGGHLEQKPFPLHPLKSQVLRNSRQLEIDRQLTGSLNILLDFVCPKYSCNWVYKLGKQTLNQFKPRCHHAAHAYTGVPCSKHKRRRSRRDARDPRDGVLPRLPGGAGNTAKSGRMRSFNPKVVLKHVYVKLRAFSTSSHRM